MRRITIAFAIVALSAFGLAQDRSASGSHATKLSAADLIGETEELLSETNELIRRLQASGGITEDDLDDLADLQAELLATTGLLLGLRGILFGDPNANADPQQFSKVMNFLGMYSNRVAVARRSLGLLEDGRAFEADGSLSTVYLHERELDDLYSSMLFMARMYDPDPGSLFEFLARYPYPS